MRPIVRGITATALHGSTHHGPLRGCALVTMLPTRDLDRLLEIARCVRFARGQNLALSGARPSSCWLLLAGYAKEHHPLGNGNEALSGFLGPGGLVADIAAIMRTPSAHDVTAMGPGEALAFEVDGLRALMEQLPTVQAAFLHVMAQRAAVAEATVVRNSVGDAMARVGLALIGLADRWGVTTPHGIRISLPLTQSELAEWVGVSRETAAKVLHNLREQGLVETSRRRLVLPDIQRLRRSLPEQREPVAVPGGNGERFTNTARDLIPPNVAWATHAV